MKIIVRRAFQRALVASLFLFFLPSTLSAQNRFKINDYHTLGSHSKPERQLNVDSDTNPQWNILLGLLNNGAVYNLSVSRISPLRSHCLISVELGLGYHNNSGQDCGLLGSCKLVSYLAIPHQLTVLIGGNKHYLKGGVGGTIITGNSVIDYLAYPTIGYQYLPRKPYRLVFSVTLQYSLGYHPELIYGVPSQETKHVNFNMIGIGFGMTM